MDKEHIQSEMNLCKQLYYENKGGCSWGKCKDCGVIPFLHKVGTGEVIEDSQKITELKKSVFGDDSYL
jgi:hypothetical protein